MVNEKQIGAARKACPPFWRDTDQCEKHIAKMLRAARLAAAEDPDLRPNLHLIKVFADDMTERNWADNRLYIKQQIDRCLSALAPQEGGE